MRIVVTGPTGNVGRKLANLLLDRGGHEIVLLARKPEGLAAEKGRGAIVVQGSLEDADYVKRATRGADAVYFLIPPKFDAPDTRAYQNALTENMANAVRANAVKRVAFQSSIGANVGYGCGPVDGLHDAEEILGKAGPNATMLRCGYFMENFLMLLDGVASSGAVFLPVSGSTRVPLVATKDIAEVAAKVLVDAGWRGVRVIPVYGARDYSFDEAARIIGDAVGKPVRHVRTTGEDLKRALVGFGASENTADVFAAMYGALESGLMRPEPPRTPEATTPTTFEEFARTIIAPALRAKMEQAAARG